MTQSRIFTSWLAPYLHRFVALKRASGRLYDSGRNLLLAFDRFVHSNAPGAPLRRTTLWDYASSLERLSPRARDNAIGVVWQAVAHAQRHGAPMEALPERPARPSRFWRQRQPRIVSANEVSSLLTAARKLPPAESLRSATMVALIGLLYATGVRIGEALALDVGDFDRCDRLLTIRKGKFGKSRVLPLRQSVTEALAIYVGHPLRPVGTEAASPFFVSGLRRRLAYPTMLSALATVCIEAGIAHPLPRPHDFRHTFAVSRMATWYHEGRNVNALLPALSTYLGHVSVENTRIYLTTNSVLLEQAAQRFARKTSALDEVIS